MVRVLIQNWWLLAWRGGCALLFAAVAFYLQLVTPPFLLRAIAFTAVVMIFGLLAVFTGVLTMLAALRGSSADYPWLLLLDGAATFAAGAAVLVLPGLTLLRLIHVIALWAVLVGVTELGVARRLRHHIKDEWLLAAAGVGSLLFGLELLPGWTRELQGTLRWLGFYALFSSATMLGLAFRLRSLRFTHHVLEQTPASPQK